MEAAERLEPMAAGNAVITDKDFWLPSDITPEEAKLGEPDGFLTVAERDIVTRWWLAVIPNANTPNWDITSTATISARRGLILSEAKAHAGELRLDGKKLDAKAKARRIRKPTTRKLAKQLQRRITPSNLCYRGGRCREIATIK